MKKYLLAFIFVSIFAVSQSAEAFRFGPRVSAISEHYDDGTFETKEWGLQAIGLVEGSPSRENRKPIIAVPTGGYASYPTRTIEYAPMYYGRPSRVIYY